MNRIGDSLFCTGTNEDIVRAFSRMDIDFIVIGGLAISWYCTDRQADDMDLLVNPTPDNSARIYCALTSLGLTCFNEDSFTKLGLQAPLKKLHYAEILTPRKEGPTFLDITKDAVDAKLFNIPIKVASLTSLLNLKKLAVASAETQINKHLKDIELLNRCCVAGDTS